MFSAPVFLFPLTVISIRKQDDVFETQFRSFRARRLFTGWSPWSLFDLRRHFLKQVLPLELIVPILTEPSQQMLEPSHSQSENSLPDFPSDFLSFCSAGQYLKMRKRKNWGSLNWPAPMIPPPPRWGNTTKTNWEKEILCSLLLTNMWMSTTKGIYILQMSSLIQIQEIAVYIYSLSNLLMTKANGICFACWAMLF